MSHPVDMPEVWPEGTVLDRAMDAAFHDAVRRHRAANIPMAMWENGEVRHVSPFDIPLPGEDLPRTGALRSRGAEGQAPGRMARGGD
jgi:hypothetical protein